MSLAQLLPTDECENMFFGLDFVMRLPFSCQLQKLTWCSELGAGTVAEVDVVLAAAAAGGNLFLCFCTATSLQSIDASYPTQKPRILRVIYLPTNFALSLHKFTKEKTSYVAYA